jgi:tRNA dimethylallyltransferase
VERRADAMNKPVVKLLIGPTASGKSAVAHHIAKASRGEILSVDSMKIYRGLDIGVAKPSAEETAEIRYHLIDWREPWESCSVAEWLREAERIIAESERAAVPLIAEGGTALYIRALKEGLFPGPGRDSKLRKRLEDEAEQEGIEKLYARLQTVDPRAAERILANDLRRIVRALEVHALTGRPISEHQSQWGRERADLDVRVVGLSMDRKRLYQRIDERVDRMLEAGWLDECRRLLDSRRPLSREAQQALGYRTLFKHLRGEATLREARDRVCFDTHHFARRQLAWYRRFENVSWIEIDEDAPASDIAEQVTRKWGLPGI